MRATQFLLRRAELCCAYRVWRQKQGHRAPLTEDAVAARFQGRGPWKKRLPQIIDTLIAVGRVRPVEGGKGYVLQ